MPRRPPRWRRPLHVVMSLALGAIVPTSASGREPDPPTPRNHTDHDEHGKPEHSEREEHEHSGMKMADMVGPLGIARAREGSGTSWLPDASPMYGLMTEAGGWHLMFHENFFVGWDWFGSDRGASRFVGIGWLMAMASHELGPSELALRVMLSPEPATLGDGGYPLVLQSGESDDGQPLHDRQHPHDLFMELSASWIVELGDDVGLQLYLAPAGEPALGPTAFPHRPSAVSDPLAPLGHHWQDATHISFGVLTAGIFTRHLKLEGSWFNGREPDEQRYDLDLRAPDSYAVRVSWNPGRAWSLQASYGFLESPEELTPEVSLHRATVSLAHVHRPSPEGTLATTLVFGENVPSEGPATPSLLIETNWDVDARHSLFARGEYLRKTGHDLVLAEALEDEAYDVAMLSLGYVHHLVLGSWAPGIGVRASAALVPGGLDAHYGTQVPLGAMIYLQLRPHAMR